MEKWVRWWIQGGNWPAVETVEGLGGLIGGERRGIRLGGWVLYKGGREKLELSGVSVVLSS